MLIASNLQQKRFLILGIISFVIIVILTIVLVYYATRVPDTIEVTPTPTPTTPVPTTSAPPVKTSDSISGVTIFLLVAAIIIALLSVSYIFFKTSPNRPNFSERFFTKPFTEPYTKP